MVRAKFRVDHVESKKFPHGYTQHQVVLVPQYDESIAEDRRFQKATPSGRLEMVVDNPVALEVLQPGRYFYLDLTPVE